MFPFNAENIQEGQIVIAGNAFPDSHEELVAAREKGIEVIRYHKFLGELLKNYKSNVEYFAIFDNETYPISSSVNEIKSIFEENSGNKIHVIQFTEFRENPKQFLA